MVNVQHSALTPTLCISRKGQHLGLARCSVRQPGEGKACRKEHVMADTYQTIATGSSPTVVLHPLEPLTAEEVAAAVSIVRTERHLSERVRFASVRLNEPPKEIVLNFKQGDPVPR